MTNFRQIAILADAHAMLEPVEAILADVKKRGITEIYSLGDNVSVGVNPSEVMQVLNEANVISIAGNAEDYITLGLYPFRYYMYDRKIASQYWTESHLTDEQKRQIATFPHSIQLSLGGKKIGLCHFANDVRFDYLCRNVLQYCDRFFAGKSGFEQFYYTNSPLAKEEVAAHAQELVEKGYISASLEPLFSGKMIHEMDAIIQGHTHWKVYESDGTTNFYAIRAAGIGDRNGFVDLASYVILIETEDGFTLEDELVPFDREKMLYQVEKSDTPDPVLRRFIRY